VSLLDAGGLVNLGRDGHRSPPPLATRFGPRYRTSPSHTASVNTLRSLRLEGMSQGQINRLLTVSGKLDWLRESVMELLDGLADLADRIPEAVSSMSRDQNQPLARIKIDAND